MRIEQIEYCQQKWVAPMQYESYITKRLKNT